MILNHNDISLSKQYTEEFNRLINFYLPHFRKYYVTLYIPLTHKRHNNNFMDTRVISIQDILNGNYIQQGATYNIYNKEETGIKWIKINNFPIWFMDTSSASNTQLTINDIVAGYIQEFNVVVYKFPLSECFTGIDSFTEAVISFDENINLNNTNNRNRLFRIESESKFAAYGQLINTIYQCKANILNIEFNPFIKEELVYNDKIHRIIKPNINQVINLIINKLNSYYNKHKQFNDFILGKIDNRSIFLDLLYLMHYFNYKPTQYTFYIPEKYLQFIDLNNYNIPSNLIQKILELKTKVLTCNITSDSDFNLTNLNLEIKKYNIDNNIIYTFNAISNIEPIDNIQINELNILYNYQDNNTIEYWLSLLIMLIILEV